MIDLDHVAGGVTTAAITGAPLAPKIKVLLSVQSPRAFGELYSEM